LRRKKLRQLISHVPSFAEEELLRAQGYHLVAGLDEVGRGSLAGPVLAAAVILPHDVKGDWVHQVRDSKLLSGKARETLFRYIQETAVSIGIGAASHEEIDSSGIVKATYSAMRLAIEQLSPAPQYLLIDYLKLPEVPLPQKGLIDGDSLCLSIACASIVAKVTRDRLIAEFDDIYHGYGFAQHKGYGTREHLACLHRMGPCPIHRKSFQPLKGFIHSGE
jgi:ribonuclease HII